jgi:hypothetical protein
MEQLVSLMFALAPTVGLAGAILVVAFRCKYLGARLEEQSHRVWDLEHRVHHAERHLNHIDPPPNYGDGRLAEEEENLVKAAEAEDA